MINVNARALFKNVKTQELNFDKSTNVHKPTNVNKPTNISEQTNTHKPTNIPMISMNPMTGEHEFNNNQQFTWPNFISTSKKFQQSKKIKNEHFIPPIPSNICTNNKDVELITIEDEDIVIDIDDGVIQDNQALVEDDEIMIIDDDDDVDNKELLINNPIDEIDKNSSLYYKRVHKLSTSTISSSDSVTNELVEQNLDLTNELVEHSSHLTNGLVEQSLEHSLEHSLEQSLEHSLEQNLEQSFDLEDFKLENKSDLSIDSPFANVKIDSDSSLNNYYNNKEELCMRWSNELIFSIKSYNKLTSIDFGYDYRAHMCSVRNSLNDYRMKYFNKAILDNKHLFKNKIVLNYYCGSGLLTLMAINAGAKLVIAVDTSRVINLARVVIHEHEVNDKVIFICGKIENIKLPVNKVDIILCDWVGHSLLNGLIPSIIYARDNWLKPNGIIFPDRAILKLIGVGDRYYQDIKPSSKHSKFIYNKSLTYWDKVYNFDYKSVKKYVLKEPIFCLFNKNDVKITKPCDLKVFDFNTISLDQVLNYSVDFKLNVQRRDYINMFSIYYEVDFVHKYNENGGINLTYSNEPNKTTRTQIFFIDQDNVIVVNRADIVCGKFSFKYEDDQNRNKMNIEIGVDFENQMCKVQKTFKYVHMDEKNYF